MSDNKRTPQIRFKGFTDDWEQRKLDKLLEQYTEVTTINDQYPALTSSRKGIFFQTEYFAGNQIASQNNVGYNIVPRNYFTYRHMSDDEIFHFNINNICDFGIVSTLYPVFTTKKELDSKYLQYQLNYGTEFAKFATLQKQGGSRTYMYFAKLKELELTIPKIEEQKKISSILSNVDKLITLHQRKCDKLVNMKKSMLEKMFPKNSEKVPEIRFKGFIDDWEQRKWSDCVDISNNMVDPRTGKYDKLPHIGPGNIESFTGQFYDNIKTVGEENLISGKFHFFSGDIIYGKINPQLGKYVLPLFEGLSSADSYVLNSKNGLAQKYLFTILQTKDFYKYSTSVSMRSGMPKINRDELNSYEFNAPSFSEQKKIGTLFTNIDNLITLHQRKLEKLNSLKKSMLEKMFI